MYLERLKLSQWPLLFAMAVAVVVAQPGPDPEYSYENAIADTIEIIREHSPIAGWPLDPDAATKNIFSRLQYVERLQNIHGSKTIADASVPQDDVQEIQEDLAGDLMDRLPQLETVADSGTSRGIQNRIYSVDEMVVAEKAYSQAQNFQEMYPNAAVLSSGPNDNGRFGLVTATHAEQKLLEILHDREALGQAHVTYMSISRAPCDSCSRLLSIRAIHYHLPIVAVFFDCRNRQFGFAVYNVDGYFAEFRSATLNRLGEWTMIEGDFDPNESPGYYENTVYPALEQQQASRSLLPGPEPILKFITSEGYSLIVDFRACESPSSLGQRIVYGRAAQTCESRTKTVANLGLAGGTSEFYVDGILRRVDGHKSGCSFQFRQDAKCPSLQLLVKIQTSNRGSDGLPTFFFRGYKMSSSADISLSFETVQLEESSPDADVEHDYACAIGYGEASVTHEPTPTPTPWPTPDNQDEDDEEYEEGDEDGNGVDGGDSEDDAGSGSSLLPVIAPPVVVPILVGIDEGADSSESSISYAVTLSGVETSCNAACQAADASYCAESDDADVIRSYCQAIAEKENYNFNEDYEQRCHQAIAPICHFDGSLGNAMSYCYEGEEDDVRLYTCSDTYEQYSLLCICAFE